MDEQMEAQKTIFNANKTRGWSDGKLPGIHARWVSVISIFFDKYHGTYFRCWGPKFTKTLKYPVLILGV